MSCGVVHQIYILYKCVCACVPLTKRLTKTMNKTFIFQKEEPLVEMKILQRIFEIIIFGFLFYGANSRLSEIISKLGGHKDIE